MGPFASEPQIAHLCTMTMARLHLTKNEDVVLRALRAARRPLSAYQIMEHTTPKGVRAPQQIYRALQGLIGHRLIHRIETLNAYLFCDHAPHDDQAAFTVCTRCRAVAEISLSKTMPSLVRSVSKTGFVVDATHVEFSGLCKNCQARDATAARAG